MNPRTRAIAALALAVVVVGALLIAYFRAVEPTSEEPALPFGHPEYEAGTPCVECHDDPHAIPYKDRPCDQCHSLSNWLNVSYRHTGASAPMSEGLHVVIGCERCHTEGRPEELSPLCFACHKERPHGGPTACERCHNATSWGLVLTPPGHFPLTGAHATIGCFDCHAQESSNFDAAGCADCHGTAHGGLIECQDCHTTTSFKPSTFVHSSVFALTGKHSQLRCSRCHADNLYARVRGTRCVSCHGTAHGGLTECQDCHTTAGFSPSRFRHSSVFPLNGRHLALACSACHPNNRFAQPIGTRCTDCHGVAHGGLTACEQCHTTAGFSPARFDHNAVFPLTGRHTRLTCSACHPGNVFGQVAGTACTNCHGVAHGGLTACQNCHTTAGFSPSTFVHSRVSPLVGQHASLVCARCHPGNLYGQSAGRNCVDCHGVAHGGQTQCERCHTPTGWFLISSFAHTTRFSLTGAHVNAECVDCHDNLVFASTPNRCAGCHTAPHIGPTNCERCHRTTGWANIVFTHVPMNYHAGLGINNDCANCHTSGNFAVYTCSGCHDDGRVYDPTLDH